MRTGMVALALGLLALRFLPALPPVWMLLSMPVLALMVLPFRSYPLGFFLLGFSWACISAQWALNDRLAVEFEGRTLWLEGRVVGLPERGDEVVRFQLADAESRRTRLPAHIRLAWYGGPPVKSGEQWRLAVKLKQPRGLLNPHGVDHEAWLLARRIGATGTVQDGRLLAPVQGGWRDRLREQLLAVDANGRSAGIAALVLGDGSGLSRDDWTVLQNTGTVHLLVISGQHIGLLAGLLYGLVAGLARLGVWPQRLPWLPWACGLAFAGALSYGLLAGFQVPVQRALVMTALVLLWRLRFRHLGLWWPLLLALNGVLLFEPLASLTVGFWLSFAAVAILVFTFGGRLGAWSPWLLWLRPQWLIAVGLFPLLWLLGLPISLSAPLANLVAVPWVSFAVLPAALAGTVLLPLPYIGEGLLWIAGGALGLLFNGLDVLARHVPAWQPPALSPWAACLVLLGAVMMLLPAGVPMRPLGWPLLIAALFAPPGKLAEGRAQIWLLDVGQGLAILVRTREHSLLYDAGPRFRDFDQGERIILPTLRKLGVRQLDSLVISHAHADHAGGAAAVARGVPVHRQLGGESVHGLNLEPCSSGEQWQWDGVHFALWRWSDAGDSNQHSCVLLIEANGERLLLTGDIDARAEQAFLRDPLASPVHWLQAPHHGSRSSSSMAFLKALQPQAALISRGRGNSFGHPHAQVLARYGALGIATYDSALNGAIRVSLGDFESAKTLRSERRFWRDLE